jgi:hypothetical protein
LDDLTGLWSKSLRLGFDSTIGFGSDIVEYR